MSKYYCPFCEKSMTILSNIRLCYNCDLIAYTFDIEWKTFKPNILKSFNTSSGSLPDAKYILVKTDLLFR